MLLQLHFLFPYILETQLNMCSSFSPMAPKLAPTYSTSHPSELHSLFLFLRFFNVFYFYWNRFFSHIIHSDHSLSSLHTSQTPGSLVLTFTNFLISSVQSALGTVTEFTYCVQNSAPQLPLFWSHWVPFSVFVYEYFHLSFSLQLFKRSWSTICSSNYNMECFCESAWVLFFLVRPVR